MNNTIIALFEILVACIFVILGAMLVKDGNKSMGAILMVASLIATGIGLHILFWNI